MYFGTLDSRPAQAGLCNWIAAQFIPGWRTRLDPTQPTTREEQQKALVRHGFGNPRAPQIFEYGKWAIDVAPDGQLLYFEPHVPTSNKADYSYGKDYFVGYGGFGHTVQYYGSETTRAKLVEDGFVADPRSPNLLRKRDTLGTEHLAVLGENGRVRAFYKERRDSAYRDSRIVSVGRNTLRFQNAIGQFELTDYRGPTLTRLNIEDFTDVKPEDLVPRAPAQSLDGKNLAEIEPKMQYKPHPMYGQRSEFDDEHVWLGENETIAAARATARAEEEALGLTNREIAEPLLLARILNHWGVNRFTYRGQVITTSRDHYLGFNECPLDPNLRTNHMLVIKNETTGKQIRITGNMVDLIDQYGFYRGNVEGREGPKEIAGLFNLGATRTP